MNRTLHAIPYSPYSNRAQWALDVAGVDYDIEPYMLVLSEPGLRRKLKKAGVRAKRITAPMMFEDGQAPLTDSFDIARRAHALNPDAGLFPDEHREDITAWNRRSNAVSAAARALVFASASPDPKAAAEALPRAMRLPGLSWVVAKSGSAMFARKYGLAEELQTAEQTLAEGLAELQTALGGRDYLFDRLTYADLALAVVLHAVDPPDAMVIGPATRPHWRRPALAERFADLLAWRDRLIERHPPQWDRLSV